MRQFMPIWRILDCHMQCWHLRGMLLQVGIIGLVVVVVMVAVVVMHGSDDTDVLRMHTWSRLSVLLDMPIAMAFPATAVRLTLPPM